MVNEIEQNLICTFRNEVSIASESPVYLLLYGKLGKIHEFLTAVFADALWYLPLNFLSTEQFVFIIC